MMMMMMHRHHHHHHHHHHHQDHHRYYHHHHHHHHPHHHHHHHHHHHQQQHFHDSRTTMTLLSASAPSSTANTDWMCECLKLAVSGFWGVLIRRFKEVADNELLCLANLFNTLSESSISSHKPRHTRMHAAKLRGSRCLPLNP